MNNGLKNSLLATGVLMASYLMVGCAVQEDEKATASEESQFEVVHEEYVNEINARLDVLVDKETGCEYIVLESMNTRSITPRLKTSGEPICN